MYDLCDSLITEDNHQIPDKAMYLKDQGFDTHWYTFYNHIN